MNNKRTRHGWIGTILAILIVLLSSATVAMPLQGSSPFGKAVPSQRAFQVSVDQSVLETPLLGDIDQDGDRDQDDARRLLQLLVMPVSPEIPTIAMVSDVNADGVINNLDAILILGIVNGQVAPPPDQTRATVIDNSDGTVTVAGGTGAVSPGSPVQLTNVTNGTTTSVTAGTDGRFSAVITGVSGNTILIDVSDGLAKTTVTVGDTFPFILNVSRLDDPTQRLQ